MSKKKPTRAKRAIASRPKMSKAQVRAHFDAFKRANDFVASERRAMTRQQRFEELIQLMQWSCIFGRRERPIDDREVWDRWNKLRDAARG